MIAIACDHTALDMKRNIEELLTDMGLEYMDFGTDSTASCDYPVFAVRAANAVVSGKCDKGILIAAPASGCRWLRIK